MDKTHSCCAKCNSFDPLHSLNFFSCKHHLCDECLFQSFYTQQFSSLLSYIDANSTNTDTLFINCTLCSKGSNHTATSRFIKHLSSPSPTKSDSHLCLRHKIQSPFYCTQCEQWFCNDCLKIHNSIGNFHHSISTSSPQKPLKCPEHQSKLKFYCDTCNKGLCSCCISLQHKEHSFRHLNELVNETVNGLEQINMDKLKKVIFRMGKFQGIFDDEYSKELMASVDFIDGIISELNELKKKYLEKMKTIQVKQNNINNILTLTYDKINRYFEDIKNEPNNISKIMFINKVINNNNNNNSNGITEKVNVTFIPKLNISKISDPNQHDRLNTQQSKLETLEDSKLIDISFSNNHFNSKKQREFHCVQTLESHKDQVRCLLELPNKSIASGSYKEIKIWSLSQSQQYDLYKTLSGHDGYVYSLLILVNGNMASCGEDETMIIWDIKNTFEQLQLIRGQTHFAKSILLLPDGLVASIAEEDSCINIRDPEKNYSCHQTLTGHKDMITSLILIPKDLIGSASLDGDIRVWEKAEDKYECKMILNDHTKAVNSIMILNTVYSECLLISCSDDGYVKIFDVNDKFKCVQNIEAHSGVVMNVISLSNENIATCSDDCTIKLWSA